MFDLDTEEVSVSRDVMFVENIFPYSVTRGEPDEKLLDLQGGVDEFGECADELREVNENADGSVEIETVMQNEVEHVTNSNFQSDSENGTENDAEPTPHVTEDDTGPIAVSDEEPTPATEPDQTHESEALGKGLRPKFLSVKLRDYVLHTVQCSTRQDEEVENQYDIGLYVSCANFSPQHRAFLAAVT